MDKMNCGEMFSPNPAARRSRPADAEKLSLSQQPFGLINDANVMEYI